MPLTKIIIVGAGPSGLLLTLLLARAGIPVDLLEQTSTLGTNPRASHYTDESNIEFERAGILHLIRSAGFSPNGVSWRRLDDAPSPLRFQRMIAIRNPDPTPEQEDQEPFKYRMSCLPLHKLGKILEGEVLKRKEARILYGRKVVEIGEEAGYPGSKCAWVRAMVSDDGEGLEGEEREERYEGDYVVGCDGANSFVRRTLFGEGVFPGFTWDRQIVATNVYYDFSGWDYDDSQFFVHPEHWHMVARIQPDGLYRVTYGELSGLTPSQLRERQPAKYAAFLPGAPTPDKYNLVNFSPYKVHQRCVDRMRVGRFLLAADAAHLCNPFGGMGLTGGIADVGSLYDSLVGIHTGQADDSILDKYDEVRRKIWHEIIDPISSENMQRLYRYKDADEFVEKDPFYKVVKGMERAKEEADVSGGPPNPGLPSLRHDMTQYYKKG